ncbi:unnamed protein product [Adineta ricciae]|uniref:Uncharacterized protein n=1 Tax=Adineta ricciae TaxID=249248 RepID=A0A814T6H5_ADIRI|nr:unnamed protein product [Adineta ricciae]CAF1155277.1 unnamed protein product [Adineta ricciae]
MNRTKLTDLHQDIWFEIFGYFYVDELLHTFAYIFNELDSILFNNDQLRFHVRIHSNVTKEILTEVNFSQIISLSIDEIEYVDTSNMVSLRSVLLNGSNCNEWMENLLQQLTFLTNIKKISIRLCYNDRGSYLLDLALRIPGLKYLYFKDLANWETNDYHQPEIQSKIYSIENIHWNFYCEFEYVKRILFYLPNLRFLQLKLLRGDEYSNETFNECNLNQIKRVHLTLCDVSFDRLISFLQTMTTIESITINGYIWGRNVISYFKSEKWKNILNINQKKKQIFVDLDLRQDYSNLSKDNIGTINYDEFERMALCVTSYTIKGVINQIYLND